MKPIFYFLPIVFLFTACTVSPDFQSPSESQKATGNDVATIAIPDSWWTLFQSKELDSLVREALNNNPSLDQVKARLMQAQEAVNAKYGTSTYPSIDAQLGASRQQIDPSSSLGFSNISDPGPFNLFNASINVAYTFDFFGANRRALESLRAQVDYQAFELEAAKRTIAANVITTAIACASLSEQIQHTRRLISAQEQHSQIIEQSYAIGGSSLIQVEQSQVVLAQTRAMLPSLEQQLAEAKHLLAILLGKSPQDTKFSLPTLDSIKTPSHLPENIPSELARQRPDIRAAEELWHVASANVGVATANLYPQITLNAALGTQSNNTGDLFNSMNVWNMGANLMQPLFRGGELRAQKRSAVAAYDEAAAAYKQTTLNALQEVADCLQAIQNDKKILTANKEAEEKTNAIYDKVHLQFDNGSINFMDVLSQETQLLQSQITRIQSQASLKSNIAALLQSLGSNSL